jgi:hypothetical protein
VGRTGDKLKEPVLVMGTLVYHRRWNMEYLLLIYQQCSGMCGLGKIIDVLINMCSLFLRTNKCFIIYMSCSPRQLSGQSADFPENWYSFLQISVAGFRQ